MSQLVYFQIPAKSSRCTGAPRFANGGVLDRTPRLDIRWLIGEVAQFDECEDTDIDECSQVPVRYRGRVMAAPLAVIRPVL